MGFYQLGQDSKTLRRTNGLVRRLAADLGGERVTVATDRDTGEDSFGIRIGSFIFSLDYLNDEDGNMFSLDVGNAAGTRIGHKNCNNYIHLKNTIGKITGMSVDDAKGYLAKR